MQVLSWRFKVAPFCRGSYRIRLGKRTCGMQSRISYLGKGAKKARPYRRGQLQRRSTCTASFAKFSLIGKYLSKSLGTTHVPVQEFVLQVFCRHLYQYICYCQYFSLVPLDPRELCERGCTVHGSLILVNMVQAEEVLGMLAGGNRRR